MPNTETPETEEPKCRPFTAEENRAAALRAPLVGGSRETWGWCNCPGGCCTCEEQS